MLATDSSAAAGPASGVDGEVTVVEELGSQSFVHVTVQHQGRDQIIVVRGAGETDVVRGDRVHLKLDGPIHLFDGDGERIGS